MLKLLHISVLALVASACSLSPNHTASFEQDNRSQIESALKLYHSEQSTLNAEQWAKHFNYPLTLILGEGITLVVKENEFINFFIPVIAYLDNQQLQSSQWERLTIRSLDQNLAIASAEVSQIDKDGNIIDQFSELYTLSKKGSLWKISSITRFSTEQYVSL